MDESFAEFVLATQPSMLRFAHALTGDPHRAADLVQDAYVAVGLKWERVRDLQHPAAYARQCVARLHVSSWRRARREVLGLVADRDASRPSDPPPIGETPMWHALAELPPRQRAVLVLRYYEDLSEREIAEVLGCRPGTVKSQASRGLATLRRHLVAAAGADPDDSDETDETDGPGSSDCSDSWEADYDRLA